jgi:hypothetical protein
MPAAALTGAAVSAAGRLALGADRRRVARASRQASLAIREQRAICQPHADTALLRAPCCRPTAAAPLRRRLGRHDDAPRPAPHGQLARAGGEWSELEKSLGELQRGSYAGDGFWRAMQHARVQRAAPVRPCKKSLASSRRGRTPSSFAPQRRPLRVARARHMDTLAWLQLVFALLRCGSLNVAHPLLERASLVAASWGHAALGATRKPDREMAMRGPWAAAPLPF